MELIQALERLSLEVKNQKINISDQFSSDVSSARTSDQNQPGLSGDINGHQNWQYPPMGVHDQLQEFDDSIETLFAQISDLDHRNPPSNHRNAPLRSAIRRTHFQLESRHLEGSMETSQEEESDCSSQRSSCAVVSGDEQDHINPMVKDLLKRDLGAITDTMKKISRILAIGNEIETIHDNFLQSSLLTNQIQTHNQADDNREVDFSYINSLCDSFLSLLASEPHIRNLPTILRYRDYCTRLMLLSRSNKLNSSMTADMSLNKGNESKIVDANLAEVEVESFEVDDDCTFLNCDERPVANWTENKLYINHYHRAN